MDALQSPSKRGLGRPEKINGGAGLSKQSRTIHCGLPLNRIADIKTNTSKLQKGATDVSLIILVQKVHCLCRYCDRKMTSRSKKTRTLCTTQSKKQMGKPCRQHTSLLLTRSPREDHTSLSPWRIRYTCCSTARGGAAAGPGLFWRSPTSESVSCCRGASPPGCRTKPGGGGAFSRRNLKRFMRMCSCVC